MTNNNTVHLIGTCVSEFELDHENQYGKFFKAEIEIERLSNVVDRIPILIAEDLLDPQQKYEGQPMEVFGEFRSYNKRTGNSMKSQLILFIYVNILNLLEYPVEKEEQVNEVHLVGYLCKDLIYRITPKKREIADVLIAVNRNYGKSDYIPSLLWGRNARLPLQIGDQVELWGRVQSRNYTKIHKDGHAEEKSAYEFSVQGINKYVEEDDPQASQAVCEHE